MEGLTYDVQKLIFSHLCDGAREAWEMRFLLGVNRGWRTSAVRYLIEAVPRNNFVKRVCWTLIEIGANVPQIEHWDIFKQLQEAWPASRFACFLMAVQFRNEHVGRYSTLQWNFGEPALISRLNWCFVQDTELLKDVLMAHKMFCALWLEERHLDLLRNQLTNEEARVRVKEREFVRFADKWGSK